MVIEQIVYPIETLGPGKRIGIWLVGCNRHCPGCSNPELWSRDGWPIIDVETAANLVSSIFSENIVDGITISGGEPMEQAAELYQLTKLLAQRTNDILLYSGYTYEEICCDPIKEAVLDNVAVLIDGRYIKEENEQLILRGSKNQHIYLFNQNLEEKYQDYFLNADPKAIQNIHIDGCTISFGIHSADFSDVLTEQLKLKGVLKHNEKYEMA